MKIRLTTGFAASLAAILIPMLLVGMGEYHEPAQEETMDAVATVTERPDSDEGRTVQAIVIHENEKTSADVAIPLTVEVDGTEQGMNLRDYLIGVLMGEMPASFEPEALKAQAVAARTYTLRRLQNGGILSDDPGVCQAFASVDGAAEKWGDNWETYLEKLADAVDTTAGQVLTYDGALIAATYFSCSGGMTESAQAVWGGEVPYLVSVTSPGEEEASAYESEVVVAVDEFLSQLEISNAAVSAVTYTTGGGVESLTIGGKTFSGAELRSLFGLRSTMFDLEIGQETVTFQVRGFGHRVGLSQYGAQAMAEEGYNYEEILKWYYTGVELQQFESV